MREIRDLKESDLEAYVTIQMNAYPGIKAARERFMQRAYQMLADRVMKLQGLFEAETLIGVMRRYDFSMQLYGAELPMGGVGGVAVDLMHKKRKVAYDLLQFCIRQDRKAGRVLTSLYPFRPDFYRKMGYGYGRQMNAYRLAPLNLPNAAPSGKVILLENIEGHRVAFRDCYNRYRLMTNGLFAMHDSLLDATFSGNNLKVAAYWEGDSIRGYLVFGFEPVPNGSFLQNELVVRSTVYESPQALRQLCRFLRSQADQIGTIVWHTQEDDFHFLFTDPRSDSQRLLPSVYHEVNTQGVGIMYRVIDTPGLLRRLQEHRFGNATLCLKVTIADTFTPAHAGSWLLNVREGFITPLAKSTPHDVEIKLDVADWSSLITGSVEFARLIRYGLAEISDTAYADTLQSMFYSERKPLCMTPF